MAIRMNVALKGGGYSLVADEVTHRFEPEFEAALVKAKLAEPISPLDHDQDGKPGGDKPEEVLIDEVEGNALWQQGGGWYRLAGPLFPDPMRIRGRKAAETKFRAVLEAGAA